MCSVSLHLTSQNDIIPHAGYAGFDRRVLGITSQLLRKTRMPKWCLICPIHPDYSDDLNAFRSDWTFTEGGSITHIPDWLRTPEFTDDLHVSQREYLIGEARLAFRVDYEAESYGEIDSSWAGPESRSKQKSAEEKVLLCQLALWLAKPSLLSNELVLHGTETNGEWRHRHSHSVKGWEVHLTHVRNSLSPDDLAKALRLYRAIELLHREGPPWLAVWALWHALTTFRWEFRFLALWTGLEALFGTNENGELRYRLAHRISFLNAQSCYEAERLCEVVSESYKYRSRVVHGLRLQKLTPDNRLNLERDAQYLLRASLVKILEDPTLVARFNTTGREKFLDSLVFVDAS